MKKNILIFCPLLAVLSFMTISCTQEHEPERNPVSESFSQTVALLSEVEEEANLSAASDIVYEIGSRFKTTLTKAQVDQAASILDMIPEHKTWAKEAFQNVGVTIIRGDQEWKEMGPGALLTAAQQQLLQSTTYSTDIVLTGRGRGRNAETQEWESDTLVYWMTIIPTQGTNQGRCHVHQITRHDYVPGIGQGSHGHIVNISHLFRAITVNRDRILFSFALNVAIDLCFS